jgi:hypothetical protein
MAEAKARAMPQRSSIGGRFSFKCESDSLLSDTSPYPSVVSIRATLSRRHRLVAPGDRYLRPRVLFARARGTCCCVFARRLYEFDAVAISIG